MNQIIPNKKKELTPKQEKFLDVLFNNGGQIMSAIEEAGYSPDSRGWLMKSVKDEIIERAKTQLAGSSVKAINRLSEGLDAFQLAQRVSAGLRPIDAVTDIKQTRADGVMPNHVQQLMIECWTHLPDARPNFEEVARRMGATSLKPA